MKSTYALFSIVFALFINYSLLAQGNKEVFPSLQNEIIEELSHLIKEEYVLEDIGSKMASKLVSLNAGSREAMSSEQFVTLLNEELQSVHLDKHLSVIEPEKFKQIQKMFGLEEGGHHDKNKGHHNKPEKSTHQDKHGNSHISHHGQNAKSILAGSRVINRDGRTKIGFLNVTRFDGTEKGLKDMQKVFASFVGVDAVIIDLRKCKGGDADMVKALSGYFFQESTYLVTTIGRKDEKGNREEKERWSVVNELSEKFKDTPLYIMTSGSTFSAAESFSFGLQLTKRALIVGENTGGGGHMNTFFELPEGYGVSISVGRTFDGKTGKGFQGIGVQADIPIEADHAFAKTLDLIKQQRTIELAYNPSKENVYQTLQQFSEAWYSGDAKSAAPLIYDICNTYFKTENTDVVKQVDLIEMIEHGFGSKTPREVRNREISIYEVRDDKTAIARLMFRDQIHYLNLINDNGSWKIISDLITQKKMHG